MGFRGIGRAGGRGGAGRLAAMTIALAVGLLLLLSGEARAGHYAVAQCGWYVGIDAGWADTTGGAKFRPDAYCVPGPPADPFDGSHAKTLTREGATSVSGNQFGRWRWSAPPGTAITQVRGSWWHALHDGVEQRVGGVAADGSFAPFLSAGGTDATPRDFVAGFATPVAAVEDRLLCARGASSSCSLAAQSWSSLRALTFTLDDPNPPAAGVGGELLADRFHRGAQAISVWGGELGSGIRFGETTIDGQRAALTEYGCGIASVGGEWRGTRMQPCPLGPAATQVVPTATFADGRHSLVHCVTDFAGNSGCTPSYGIKIDNNAPTHPVAPYVKGGDGWRRTNEFDVFWSNPSQDPGSPIVGASWRLTGPGYDSGDGYSDGRDRTHLQGVKLPAAGEYAFRFWLRDEVGNENGANSAAVPLRFDDVPPALTFGVAAPSPAPEAVLADVADPLSGPAAGSISYRRADSERWLELPTRLAPAGSGKAQLTAPTPQLADGVLYLFRAEAKDGAGNLATTTLRADGTRMELRGGDAGPGATKGAGGGGAGGSDGGGERAKARLFARLRGGRGRGHGAGGRGGDALTVPFGGRASLSGRLVSADGAPLAGRELRVLARPSRGALSKPLAATPKTGEHGGFSLRLAPGPSRKLAVVFAGDGGLRPAARRGLDLRVRGGVSLAARPERLRTGQTVRLSGRVRTRGAAVPRRGKLVAIQYLEQATGSWRPVLVTRSDHGGRFHARYRFRYVSGEASIRLRATALAEERWPYAPGSSPPVTVRVSG